MLTGSSLYLSTCALEWWQQMVSAVQKHLDKFMRPLVHKWMQNYLAGVSPAVPGVQICWSSAGGVNHRGSPGLCCPREHCWGILWNLWGYGMNPFRPLLSNASMDLGFFGFFPPLIIFCGFFGFFPPL